MTDTVQPALTPEEWADLEFGDEEGDAWIHGDGVLYVVSEGGWCAVTPKRPHALAALALHDQPFGFTRDDVVRLCEVAREWELTTGFLPTGTWLLGLAVRIEALLPPDTSSNTSPTP